MTVECVSPIDFSKRQRGFTWEFYKNLILGFFHYQWNINILSQLYPHIIWQSCEIACTLEFDSMGHLCILFVRVHIEHFYNLSQDCPNLRFGSLLVRKSGHNAGPLWVWYQTAIISQFRIKYSYYLIKLN